MLNVDSQASYDNIVVQVIGEMSNKNQPHHKFVQTFILATQPNGYFVLNDIFRYLSADDDEVVDDEPVAEPESNAEQAPGEQAPITTPARTEENVSTESAAVKVDEKLYAAVEEPSQSVEEVNGTEESLTEADDVTDDTPATESAAEPEPAVEEPASTPAPEADEPSVSATTEAESEAPAAASASASEVPAAKKTWASMVGNRAPVVPVVPQTTAPVSSNSQSKPRTATTPTQPQTSKTPEPTPSVEASTPTSQSNGWQEAGKKTKQQSKPQEGVVHAYIKNVNDKIDARVLREVLEKYGKLKYYDVSRPKVSS